LETVEDIVMKFKFTIICERGIAISR